MNLLTTFLIAIGLSADAVAVALCSGSMIRHLTLNKVLKIALFFGVFQAVMTLLGWLIGTSISSLIQAVDHWIAFGLLVGIGGKMVYESFHDAEEHQKMDPLDTHTLMALSIATSIDALAVGISIATFNVAIFKAGSLIGSTTFLLAFAGVFVGHRFGSFLGKKVELIGGTILISIGLKILVEHLSRQV